MNFCTYVPDELNLLINEYLPECSVSVMDDAYYKYRRARTYFTHKIDYAKDGGINQITILPGNTIQLDGFKLYEDPETCSNLDGYDHINRKYQFSEIVITYSNYKLSIANISDTTNVNEYFNLISVPYRLTDIDFVKTCELESVLLFIHYSGGIIYCHITRS